MKKIYSVLFSAVLVFMFFSCQDRAADEWCSAPKVVEEVETIDGNYFVMRFDCTDSSQINLKNPNVEIQTINTKDFKMLYRRGDSKQWKKCNLDFLFSKKFYKENLLLTSKFNLLDIAKGEDNNVSPFEIAIKGIIYIGFNDKFNAKVDDFSILCPVELNQWGTSMWRSTKNMFAGFKELKVEAKDIPILRDCKEADFMFAKTAVDSVYNIEKWNTSSITSMSGMFYQADKFNQDLSAWNVDNVKKWTDIFTNCPIKQEYKPEKFR